MLCPYYIACSCLTIFLTVGPVGLILCLTVPSIMFTIHLTRNRQLVWVAWWLILLLFNAEPVTNSLQQLMSTVQEGDYKVSVMVAWIILRSLSFCLETCDSDPDNKVPVVSQILTLFSYCLYLPLIFIGPYMPYPDFIKGLNAPYIPWTKTRIFKLMLQFARFFWWYSVANFLTYHFYGHAFHWSPNIVLRMNSWTLAGFIYYLIIFFIIKYVVLYGFPGVLASIEGYEAPHPPKCVLILCRFSQLWRNFDAGLYNFMTRYIYKPWISYAGTHLIAKLQGIALVFTFVYVWHGVTPQVLTWAAINCLGVVMEKSADTIALTSFYQKVETKLMSIRMQRRWHGLLSMVLLVPSVASLSIFLTSVENARTVGHAIFIKGFPYTTASMMFFMYCIAQIGFEMKNFKLRREQKSYKTK